jgi:hypothetical protein
MFVGVACVMKYTTHFDVDASFGFCPESFQN